MDQSSTISSAAPAGRRAGAAAPSCANATPSENNAEGNQEHASSRKLKPEGLPRLPGRSIHFRGAVHALWITVDSRERKLETLPRLRPRRERFRGLVQHLWRSIAVSTTRRIDPSGATTQGEESGLASTIAENDRRTQTKGNQMSESTNPRLENCRDCGGLVSIDAANCVHCGALIDHRRGKKPETRKRSCPDCNGEMNRAASVCPHCGCPQDHQRQA